MIIEATISYRLPGDSDVRTVAIEVDARNEADAFDQAVEEAKLELIRQVLQLRPWAVKYAYQRP